MSVFSLLSTNWSVKARFLDPLARQTNSELAGSAQGAQQADPALVGPSTDRSAYQKRKRRDDEVATPTMPLVHPPSHGQAIEPSCESPDDPPVRKRAKASLPVAPPPPPISRKQAAPKSYRYVPIPNYRPTGQPPIVPWSDFLFNFSYMHPPGPALDPRYLQRVQELGFLGATGHPSGPYSNPSPPSGSTTALYVPESESESESQSQPLLLPALYFPQPQYAVDPSLTQAPSSHSYPQDPSVFTSAHESGRGEFLSPISDPSVFTSPPAPYIEAPSQLPFEATPSTPPTVPDLHTLPACSSAESHQRMNDDSTLHEAHAHAQSPTFEADDMVLDERSPCQANPEPNPNPLKEPPSTLRLTAVPVGPSPDTEPALPPAPHTLPIPAPNTPNDEEAVSSQYSAEQLFGDIVDEQDEDTRRGSPAEAPTARGEGSSATHPFSAPGQMDCGEQGSVESSGRAAPIPSSTPSVADLVAVVHGLNHRMQCMESTVHNAIRLISGQAGSGLSQEAPGDGAPSQGAGTSGPHPTGLVALVQGLDSRMGRMENTVLNAVRLMAGKQDQGLRLRRESLSMANMNGEGRAASGEDAVCSDRQDDDDGYDAETDKASDSRGSVSGGVKRRRKKHGFAIPKGPRKYKPKAILDLHETIRDACLSMLNRAKVTDDFPHPAPTAEEIHVFETTGQGGPSLEHIMFDPSTTDKSGWNKAFVEVCANWLVAHEWVQEDVDLTLYKKHFATHLKTLRNHYRALHPDIDSEETRAHLANLRELQKVSSRRRARKENLSSWREDTCEFYDELEALLKILRRISVDAHSDDESDHESSSRRYVISVLCWRSAEARDVLRTLDLLHLSTHFRSDGTPTRGNWPRFRQPRAGAPVRTGEAAVGLPRNWYSDEFLASLTERKQEELDIQPVFHFKFSDKLRQIAADHLPFLTKPGLTRRPPGRKVSIQDLDDWLARVGDEAQARSLPAWVVSYGFPVYVSQHANTPSRMLAIRADGLHMVTWIYWIFSWQGLVLVPTWCEIVLSGPHRNQDLAVKEPTLYSSTVRLNVLLGATKPHDQVMEEEVRNACHDAKILKFSEAVWRSEGIAQAQAQALLHNPRILLFDEATSALDSNSEKIALYQAAKGRTTFATAHRLLTTQNADYIYFIKEGVVTEKGTHDGERIALRGGYYEYVQLQALRKAYDAFAFDRPPTVDPWDPMKELEREDVRWASSLPRPPSELTGPTWKPASRGQATLPVSVLPNVAFEQRVSVSEQSGGHCHARRLAFVEGVYEKTREQGIESERGMTEYYYLCAKLWALDACAKEKEVNVIAQSPTQGTAFAPGVPHRFLPTTTGTHNGHLYMWSLISGSLICDIDAGGPVTALEWPAQHSTFVYAGFGDGLLARIDIETHTLRVARVIAYDTGSVEHIAIASTDNSLLSTAANVASGPAIVTLWRAESNAHNWCSIMSLPSPPPSFAVDPQHDAVVVTGLHWIEDPIVSNITNAVRGGLLLSSYLSHTVICWNIATHTIAWRVARHGCGACTLSPDRKYLAVQTMQPAMLGIYSTLARDPVVLDIKLERCPKATPLPVLFIHQGRALLTGSRLGKVRIWDTKLGDCWSTLRHQDAGQWVSNGPEVRSLAAYSNGKSGRDVIVTGTAEGRASVVSVFIAAPENNFTSNSNNAYAILLLYTVTQDIQYHCNILGSGAPYVKNGPDCTGKYGLARRTSLIAIHLYG
ncbi:hypothetical protein K488DRAFT_74484 [Vararia minispora EC-137]|uniref:Uncharacterized protein n=1 Tax=Vararia minispora EC-137 TaxID=1314806 RepID=A0ACB8Q6Q8_9AGAM|nr:hypothetical protein K488DRAFT_74484 [Vararia minispora EC-137]